MRDQTVIVGEIQAGRATVLRKKLMGLAGDIQASTFDLAGLLAEAAQAHMYQAWGYQSIVEYGAEELGLKARKVQYLVRMVEVMRIVGIKREAYEPVGVTKLREITTLDPAGKFYNKETQQNEPLLDHIVRLITVAEDMSAEQIKEEVRRLKGQTGENSIVVRSTSYVKSVWDNVISPARELARRQMGSAGRDEQGNAVEYSDGAVDEMIYASYLADPNNHLEVDQEVIVKIPTEEDVTI